MFVMPGPPSSRKIGRPGCAERARMRVTGNAISRDCGSARFSGTTACRSRPGSCRSRSVVARLQGQLPGVRALGHGGPPASGANREVARGRRSEREGDDRAGRKVRGGGVPWLLLRWFESCLDARSATARRHRRKAASGSDPAMIRAPPQVGGGRPGSGVRSAVSDSVRPPARRSTLLIVLAAIESALEVAPARRRREPRADAVVRRAGGRVSCCRCSRAGAFRSRRRRGVAARRGAVVRSTAGSSSSRRASSLAGMAAAFLLGNLRDARQARIGLADRARQRGDHRLQRPAHAAGELVSRPGACSRSPGSAASRCASAPNRRRGRGARDAGRARARDGGAHRRRRGARAHRPRAARHRRPRRQRDGAAGRRRAAPAARRARRGRGRAARRRGDGPLGARPRCAGCSAPCARDGRRTSSSRRSRASTGSTRCSTRSAAPACRCELHVDGEPVPLPPAIDLSAYRIVQEGLTNALKHAHASQADVTSATPDELRIEVRDDGDGAATTATASATASSASASA